MFSREAAENVAEWMEGGRREREGGDKKRVLKRMDGWEKCGICKVRDELNLLGSNALETRGDCEV